MSQKTSTTMVPSTGTKPLEDARAGRGVLAGRNAGAVKATPFSCVNRSGSSPGTASGCTI